MKEVVLKLDYQDDKGKQNAMKTVAGLDGVVSIVMDAKDKKLTVTGGIDPVNVCEKLRKLCNTEMLKVGPAKEPEKKKEEPKKMKEVVLKLDYHDDKGKQNATNTAAGLDGVVSIVMDVKDKKLMVTGDIDPFKVCEKLRKLCYTEILKVERVKEPEKKEEEPKKMKEVVLKLDYHDDKGKQNATNTAAGLDGVKSIDMDAKDKKLTVTGDIDPFKVCEKLRKLCYTEILKVGPAKEPEKKEEEPKKMKEVVLKLDYHDDKGKQNAMKTAAGLDGVVSIVMDAKDKKLTVIGDIDAGKVWKKLRKVCYTEILTVGPAKERVKKQERKKKEPKKSDEKKEEPKK